MQSPRLMLFKSSADMAYGRGLSGTSPLMYLMISWHLCFGDAHCAFWFRITLVRILLRAYISRRGI
jgi:hypothetical protein